MASFVCYDLELLNHFTKFGCYHVNFKAFEGMESFNHGDDSHFNLL